MIDRFLLSGGRQYLKVGGAISDKLLKRCLTQAASKSVKVVETKIRELHRYGHESQYVSWIVFKHEKRPPFLTTGEERDVVHGYLVIVEIDDYLIISKSHAHDFMDLLDRYVKKIDIPVLNAALLDRKSAIEKATAKAIDTKRDSLRRVTYEAQRLEVSMPTLGASSKTLTNLKHDTDGRKVSVTGNSSKVNVLGTRVAIKEFVMTSSGIIKKIERPPKKHQFLDNFATQLKFSDHSRKIIPTEILFSINEVVDYLSRQENPAPRLFYRIGQRRHYLKDDFVSYLTSVSGLLDIKTEGKGSNRRFIIINKFDRTLQICLSEKGYYLESGKFSRLYLEFDDENIVNLQRFINKRPLFNLTFNTPDIHYAFGALWKDNKLLENIDGFLQMFVPDTALENIVSEKGIVGSTSRQFQLKTLFRYVEKTFRAGVDHLVLDDLGYETADYIGVEKLKKIQLFHCKASTSLFSATAFQEVVGQVLKNLHFFTQVEEVDGKISLWKKRYIGSRIPRIRAGDKINLMTDLKDSLAATNCDKEVHLVVNFLSLNELKKNLTKLKVGKNAPKSTLPMLWLLSSLKNSCAERNIKIYIHCKP